MDMTAALKKEVNNLIEPIAKGPAGFFALAVLGVVLLPVVELGAMLAVEEIVITANLDMLELEAMAVVGGVKAVQKLLGGNPEPLPPFVFLNPFDIA